MEVENSTKAALIEAFNKSETKSVADLCRHVGISRFVFYYHFNKDADFRRKVMAKRLEHLARQMSATA